MKIFCLDYVISPYGELLYFLQENSPFRILPTVLQDQHFEADFTGKPKNLFWTLSLFMGNYLLRLGEGLAKLLFPHPTKITMTVEKRETMGKDIHPEIWPAE